MEFKVKPPATARRWLAPLLVVLLGLGACGGGTTGAPKSAAAKTAATPSASEAATVGEYCASSLALETAPDPNVDFQSLPPDQQKAEAQLYAKQTIRPLADKVVATAPDEIEKEIAVLNKAVTEVEKTGNFEVSQTPEVVKAAIAAHAFDLRNCGWNKVDVTAVDYSFGGVSPELKAGNTSFEFMNSGTEHHEMVIYRRNDDATETFDQLLALPQEEAMKKVTVFGSTDAEPNQEGSYDVVDLKPGHYAMICFYPVGSTPDAEKTAQAAGKQVDGPPHYTKGMKTEFGVS
jgi:hypothetical protein